MAHTTLRVAVTGAAGSIAYHFLFQMMDSIYAGYDVELRLLDLHQSLGILQAVKMELEDCAFKNLLSVVITDDPMHAFQNAQWIIMLGAHPRGKGMERSDLLACNGEIFSQQGSIIGQYADPNVQVVVVGNPCNTNAMIASAHAPQLPVSSFTAMMMLDSMRALSYLSSHMLWHTQDVRNVIVWGNHSQNVVADAGCVRVKNQPYDIDQVWRDTVWIPFVQQRGAQVIAQKGSSSSASAAYALIQHIHYLMQRDTDIFSLAVCSRGEYGSHPGTWVSLPHRMVAGERQVVLDLPLDAALQAKIQLSFDDCAHERDICKKLALIS